MTESDRATPNQNVGNWTRDGFVGDVATTLRPQYGPDYISVEGPHAPHTLNVHDLAPPDRSDPTALPLAFAASRAGVRLSVSGRSAPMPFVVRNVEADEVHFVQEGEIRFATEFGALDAGPGDFVVIPRSVSYRAVPLRTPTLVVLVESPWAVRLDTPAPGGMINRARDIARAQFGGPEMAAAGPPYTLVLKTFDGETRFTKPHDPLAAAVQVGGESPVWKVNLARISPHAYVLEGGPPSHFMVSRNKEVLFYTLSARPGARPPIHDNADYDEVIHFFRGPGAWGAVERPGTITWVPKGVTHQGPPENVPEGYLAWLFESASTLRLTPAGRAAAVLMETATYGPHPAAKRESRHG
jgi:homogentisate 1,2-dioxygenase